MHGFFLFEFRSIRSAICDPEYKISIPNVCYSTYATAKVHNLEQLGFPFPAR